MAVSSCARVFSSFECRSDPDFSAAPRFEKLGQGRFTARLNAAAGGTAAFHGLSSLILRFPPNFQRQLSTKARRNCSNIGVAQIVAASWSNNSPAHGVPASSAGASAVDATSATTPLSVAPVELAADDDVVVSRGSDGNGPVQFQASIDTSYYSFLNTDGSIAIHAGAYLSLLNRIIV